MDRILVLTKIHLLGGMDFCANKIKTMQHAMPLLDCLHQQTERSLRKAIASWQTLPPDALTTPPSPGQWSAAQCLEHLNIYGRYYLPTIEKAIEQAGQRNHGQKSPQAPAMFRPGWLGAYFTKLMRPRPDGQLTSKMKAPKNAVPAAVPDARAVLAEFIDQQEKMLRLLDRAASINLNQVRIPVSIAPWLRLKLGDTFSFVIAHIERHILQADRAIEAFKPAYYTVNQISEDANI